MLNALNEFAWTLRSKYSTIPEYDFDSQEEVHHNYMPIKWTRQSVISLGISAAVGALFGIIVATAVNTTLVEISVSSSFSLYFGVLFVFVGLVIIWRTIVASRAPHPDDSPAAKTPRKYLIVFACLVSLRLLF